MADNAINNAAGAGATTGGATGVAGGATGVAGGADIMRFDDFCFAYDGHVALRHVDLGIKRGQSVVLLGCNGCGKSTLLRAMSGLIFPQQGAYYFDGQRVDAASMKDQQFAKRLHQRVGFIFQDSDAQLFCASVEDEIAFGPRQMGLTADQVKQRVDDVIDLLGIDHLRTRAPYHLSGGEKKKVAIACILSMGPEAYCFDEPLNGLDIETRTWLLDFLLQLKAAGKTLVIATHDMSLAKTLGDCFVYMGPGYDGCGLPGIRINE